MLQQQVSKSNKPKHIILTLSKAGTVYTVPRGRIFRGIPYITSPNGEVEISINGVKLGLLSANNLSHIYGKSPLELYEGDTFAVTYLSHISGLIGVEYDA